jgi:exodeoxyribonuclease X
MRALVLDTETTGMDETDQVIEMAAVELQLPQGKEVNRWRSFLMPDVYVKPDARAAHHITDDELVGAPTMMELQSTEGLPPAFREEGTIFVAHNMAFDKRLLMQTGLDIGDRVLCTWKLARHLYPNAPNHSNQTLRYWLGVEVPPFEGHPHRALPDALVTASVFQHMLGECKVETMFELMDRPVLLTTCYMGENKGKPWADQDVGLLRWVLHPKRTFDVDVIYTARYWLDQPRDRQGRLLP